MSSRKNPQDYSVLNLNRFNELCFVLGVKELSCYDPDKKAIERAFRKRALKTHPDKGGDPIEFKKINDAYNKLIGHIFKLEQQAEQNELAESILIEVSKTSLPKWVEKLKKSYGYFKSSECKCIIFEGPYKQFKGRGKMTGPITIVLYEDPQDAIPKIHIRSPKFMAWIAEQMMPVHMHVDKGKTIQFNQWRIAHPAEFGIEAFKTPMTPAPERKAPAPTPAPENKPKRKARDSSVPKPKTRRDSEPSPSPGAGFGAGDNTPDKENQEPDDNDDDNVGENEKEEIDPKPRTGKKIRKRRPPKPKPPPPEYVYNCGHCGSGFNSMLEFNYHKTKCIPDEDFNQYAEHIKAKRKQTDDKMEVDDSKDKVEEKGNHSENKSTASPKSASDKQLRRPSDIDPSIFNFLTGMTSPPVKKSADEPSFTCIGCSAGFQNLKDYGNHKKNCSGASPPSSVASPEILPRDKHSEESTETVSKDNAKPAQQTTEKVSMENAPSNPNASDHTVEPESEISSKAALIKKTLKTTFHLKRHNVEVKTETDIGNSDDLTEDITSNVNTTTSNDDDGIKQAECETKTVFKTNGINLEKTKDINNEESSQEIQKEPVEKDIHPEVTKKKEKIKLTSISKVTKNTKPHSTTTKKVVLEKEIIMDSKNNDDIIKVADSKLKTKQEKEVLNNSTNFKDKTNQNTNIQMSSLKDNLPADAANIEMPSVDTSSVLINDGNNENLTDNFTATSSKNSGYPVSRPTPVQQACKSTTFVDTTHVDALNDVPDNLEDMQVDDFKNNDNQKKVKKIRKKRLPKPKTPPPEYVYNCNNCDFGFNSMLEFNHHKTKCIPTGKSWNFTENNKSEKLDNNRDKHTLTNKYEYPNHCEEYGMPNEYGCKKSNDSLNAPKYNNFQYIDNLQENIPVFSNSNADNQPEFKHELSKEYRASYSITEYAYNCGHCGSGYNNSLEFDIHKSICIPDEDFSQFEEQSTDKWKNYNGISVYEEIKPSGNNQDIESIKNNNKIDIEAPEMNEDETLVIINPSDNINKNIPNVTSSPSVDIITATQISETHSSNVKFNSMEAMDEAPKNYDYVKTHDDDKQLKTPEVDNHIKTPEDDNYLKTNEDDDHIKTPKDENQFKTHKDDYYLKAPEEDNFIKTPEDENHLKTHKDDNYLKTSEGVNHLKTPEEDNHLKTPAEDTHLKTPIDDIHLKADNTINRKLSKKGKRIKIQRPPPKPKDPPPEYVYNCSECESGFNSMLEFNYHKTKCNSNMNTCHQSKQNNLDSTTKKSDIKSKHNNDSLKRGNSYQTPKIAEYRQPTISQDIKSEFQSLHLRMKQIEKEDNHEDDLQLVKKKRQSKLMTPPLETPPLEYVYNCSDCNSGFNSMLEFNYHKRKCIPDKRFKEISGSKEKANETSKDETIAIINKYTKKVDNEEEENTKSMPNVNGYLEKPSELSPDPDVSYTYTEISVEYNFQYNEEEETLSSKSQVNNSLTDPTVNGNQQDKLPSESKSGIFSTGKQSLADTYFNSTDSLNYINDQTQLNFEQSNLFRDEQCLAEKAQLQNLPENDLHSDKTKSLTTFDFMTEENQHSNLSGTNFTTDNKQQKDQPEIKLTISDNHKHNSPEIKPLCDDNPLLHTPINKRTADKDQNLKPPDLYEENNLILSKSQSVDKLTSDNKSLLEPAHKKTRPTSQVIFLSPNSFLPAPPPVTTVMLYPKKHYKKHN